MEDAKHVLDTAARVINGPRSESYGHPRESFQRIAELWSAFLGLDIEPNDVASMMILLKLVREDNCHYVDNLVDIAGYAALMNEVAATPSQES